VALKRPAVALAAITLTGSALQVASTIYGWYASTNNEDQGTENAFKQAAAVTGTAAIVMTWGAELYYKKNQRLDLLAITHQAGYTKALLAVQNDAPLRP